MTWTSSIPSLAAVNSVTGLLRALFPGTARVRASLGLAAEGFANVTWLTGSSPGPAVRHPSAPIPAPIPIPTQGAAITLPASAPRMSWRLTSTGTDGWTWRSATDGPIGIVHADFNRDGREDLAVTQPSNYEIQLLLGDGSGNFRLGSFFTTGRLPYYLTTGDFDGLNGPDLAVAIPRATA